MTAPAKPAGNGTKPASNDTRPERISGMARIREAQTYHLSSLAHDAAFEAERLCSQIYRTASDGYLREPATTEAPNAADDPATYAKAREALACLATAITYINYLFDVLPDA